jgi:hypothetical protein
MAAISQQNGAETMLALILKAKKQATPEYGGNVMPAIELFRKLQHPEERRDYQAALELMLRHEKEELRDFAVTLCLGFFVFRDVR